jgi:hypothetical protein
MRIHSFANATTPSMTSFAVLKGPIQQGSSIPILAFGHNESAAKTDDDYEHHHPKEKLTLPKLIKNIGTFFKELFLNSLDLIKTLWQGLLSLLRVSERPQTDAGGGEPHDHNHDGHDHTGHNH